MILENQRRQVDAWNHQLQRQGYQVDWLPEMLQSQLPDGRSLVVPVHQVRVRPIGQ